MAFEPRNRSNFKIFKIFIVYVFEPEHVRLGSQPEALFAVLVRGSQSAIPPV
jgi:hypothetical protein